MEYLRHAASTAALGHTRDGGARARRDPGLRGPARVGRGSRRAGAVPEPGGARGARLRRAGRAARPARPRHDPLPAPRRLPLPRGGVPDDAGAGHGRDRARVRRLVHPPRRLDVPGLLHLDADRPAGRPGRGRRLPGHDGAARGRAGAARARGDPGERRPARVGARSGRRLPLPQPRRGRRAWLRRRRRAAGPAGARDGPLQAPGRLAVSGRGVHARAGPDARGDAARARRLPRPQGRVDHARDLLDVAVRARRRPRIGHRVQRRRGAPACGAGGARARRRRGAGRGAPGRAAARDRGGGRRACSARARSARRRAAGVRQRGHDAPPRRAAHGDRPGARAGAAREQHRAGG